MIHFDTLTLDNVKLKVGIDMDTPEKKLYVEFNLLMPIFNFTMMDKTTDDVTVALMGTEYRNHIYVDESCEVMEQVGTHISQELWVDIPCLKFLRDESVAPFVMDDIVNFLAEHEQELRQELLSTIDA